MSTVIFKLYRKVTVIKLQPCVILSPGSKTLVFIKNQGKVLDVQHEMVARLKKRLDLQEVDSVEKCDVIMAFVPIVSRAGTDIEAALQKIPSKTSPLVN